MPLSRYRYARSGLALTLGALIAGCFDCPTGVRADRPATLTINEAEALPPTYENLILGVRMEDPDSEPYGYQLQVRGPEGTLTHQSAVSAPQDGDGVFHDERTVENVFRMDGVTYQVIVTDLHPDSDAADTAFVDIPGFARVRAILPDTLRETRGESEPAATGCEVFPGGETVTRRTHISPSGQRTDFSGNAYRNTTTFPVGEIRTICEIETSRGVIADTAYGVVTPVELGSFTLTGPTYHGNRNVEVIGRLDAGTWPTTATLLLNEEEIAQSEEGIIAAAGQATDFGPQQVRVIVEDIHGNSSARDIPMRVTPYGAMRGSLVQTTNPIAVGDSAQYTLDISSLYDQNDIAFIENSAFFQEHADSATLIITHPGGARTQKRFPLTGLTGLELYGPPITETGEFIAEAEVYLSTRTVAAPEAVSQEGPLYVPQVRGDAQ